HNIVPSSTFQILIARSLAEVATSSPFGDMETNLIPARCSGPPSQATFSPSPTSIAHLEILIPSLARIVLPPSSGIATRNVPVPLEESFQIGSEPMSKNLIEPSSP